MSSSEASSPERAPRAAAVIVAGGAGRRMAGMGIRKQYLEIEGSPVLLRAIEPFLAHPLVSEVIVVLPEDDVHRPPVWLDGLPITIAAGGAERGDSVWNGIAVLPKGVEVVLVHDGARPFVSGAVIDRVIEGARSGGAVAAVRVTDTLKRGDESGQVVGTVDRSGLWCAQTPQGFPAAVLRAVYARARREGWVASDDAALCERCGVPVRLVEGARENIKITHADDLRAARVLAHGLREEETRGI